MNQKTRYIYTMEYYAAERKKELLSILPDSLDGSEIIMLIEISQVVKDKYHMISPLTGAYSTKQTSKQNITRDIEIKNNLTVTRGVEGGDNEGQGGRVFRNNYKGHIDKTKWAWKQGRE